MGNIMGNVIMGISCMGNIMGNIIGKMRMGL